MHTNDTTARRILGREIAAALPLDALARQVETHGLRALGSARIFERELSSRPDDFRFLNPWSGPWKGPGHHGIDRRRVPWIQLRRPADRGPTTDRPETLLAESIRLLGISVDADSFTALARWLRLIDRANALRNAAYVSSENQPERHSSSASEVSSDSPARLTAA